MKEGGTVFVLWGGGTSAANQPPNIDVPTDQSELVEELRDRVRYLERQVEEERGSRRRADTLLAQLMQRIPELEAPREAPQEPREAPETVAHQMPMGPEPQEARAEAQEAAQPRSWWRRMFGG